MDRFAIIGLGRFGYRLAELLAQAGAEVVAIDRDTRPVEDIRDAVTLAIALDATDERALVSQGISQVDVAVVSMGTDFEANVLATVILKQLGVPRVICRAASSSRGEILRRVGADAVVYPEEESAHRWCHRLLGPRVMEQIPLAEGHSMAQIPVPAEWVGKSLTELQVRSRYNVNVVAIRRAAPSAGAPKEVAPVVLEMPLPHSKLGPGDVLVLIGADADIADLPR